MAKTKNTGTDMFQKQIKQYLDKRASEDALFAASYNKKHKNIEDCVAYIIGEVQKAGKSAWADEEIYGMAVHYYDEDNLKAKPYKGNVQIVSTQLADDVKDQLNREAEEMYREELLRKMRHHATRKIRKRLVESIDIEWQKMLDIDRENYHKVLPKKRYRRREKIRRKLK